MKIQVTTTIVSLVDLDTMEPEHSVSVHSDDPIPAELAQAVVVGACKSVLRELRGDDSQPEEPTGSAGEVSGNDS